MMIAMSFVVPIPQPDDQRCVTFASSPVQVPATLLDTHAFCQDPAPTDTPPVLPLLRDLSDATLHVRLHDHAPLP